LWFARHSWLWAGVALVVAGIAIAVWLFRVTARRPQAAPEVIPLTTYAGIEQSPSFSPDGNQVVFSWNGEKQDNFDIYLKLIGSPNAVRLTTDPGNDISPAFAPDGRSIGFVRISKGHASFMLIPSIGGPERPVVEVSIRDVVYGPGPLFSWLPDGKWVVTDGLALLSTESGVMQSLTSPPTKLLPDFSPSVSPDGHTVVFSRSVNVGVSELYLLELTDDLKPKAEPRRLTSLGVSSWGSVWVPKRRDIIFTAGVFGGSSNLWKVSASGNPGPQQLPFLEEASRPAMSRSGDRLAYQRATANINVWRLSLSGRGIATGLPVKLITSTRFQGTAQYSPDGKHIAFESDRSGLHGVWICDADGSNFVGLFLRVGASGGDPRWSPDGQRIAFAFNLDGKYSIYVIKASGGEPIRVTTDSAYDRTPSWSGDGKWIYFASIRTGRWEVWKVPAGGGEALQVTHNGGEVPFESPDGKLLYYRKEVDSSLWKMPVNGGEESRVLPDIGGDLFCPVNGGIYFVPTPGTNTSYSIQFLSFATGKVRTVAPMSAPPAEGLSVSPDGRFLLFSQVDQTGSDLMLVENFQ
jgi:Tol biopolymer transport system component